MMKKQESILDNAKDFVKINGKLYYMTCSILSLENLSIIQKFIEKYPNFDVHKYKSILPTEYKSDGFFFAELIKKY